MKDFSNETEIASWPTDMRNGTVKTTRLVFCDDGDRWPLMILRKYVGDVPANYSHTIFEHEIDHIIAALHDAKRRFMSARRARLERPRSTQRIPSPPNRSTTR